MAFVGDQHQAWRLGGDEFAILLHDVHTETEVRALCATLSEQFLQPFNLHNGHTATPSLSIGYALTSGTHLGGGAAGTGRSEYVSDEKPAFSSHTKIRRNDYAQAIYCAHSSGCFFSSLGAGRRVSSRRTGRSNEVLRLYRSRR